jgi:hypothetical protein
MNRHMRRSDMRTFRRAELLTHCIDAADAALEGHKLLKDAAANFHLPHAMHRPFCISCKASFVADNAKVGSYLFAMPLNVDGLVATSGICTNCTDALSASQLDAICTRVLRKLVPHGDFIDAR